MNRRGGARAAAAARAPRSDGMFARKQNARERARSNQGNPFATAPRGPDSIVPNVPA